LVYVLRSDVILQLFMIGPLDRSALAVRFLLSRGDVEPIFADRRQYFRGDPLLESFGLGFAALHNQRVQSRFVDEGGFLLPADGVGNADPIPFVIIQTTESILMIDKSQNLAYIFAHKPRFTLEYNIANCPKIRVLENT